MGLGAWEAGVGPDRMRRRDARTPGLGTSRSGHMSQLCHLLAV